MAKKNKKRMTTVQTRYANLKMRMTDKKISAAVKKAQEPRRYNLAGMRYPDEFKCWLWFGWMFPEWSER